MKRFLSILAIFTIATFVYAADQRIQYTESMVGANHPTKADTLNRMMLIEHTIEGIHSHITTTGAITTTGVVSAGSAIVSGVVSAGSITTGSINSVGAITTGSLSSSGSITAGNVYTPGNMIAVGSGSFSSLLSTGTTTIQGATSLSGNINSSGTNILSGTQNITGAIVSSGTNTLTGAQKITGVITASGGLTSSGTNTLSNIKTADQIVSTVSTGTAPFVVSSTTEVPNLHAAVSTTTLNIAQPSQSIYNLSFTATVAANAITVSLKTQAGITPTSVDYGEVTFRSATLTSGGYDRVQVTSVVTSTLSQGSTLGFIANEIGRIYLWLINNSGVVELAFSRTADIFPESNLVTTTAEGGAGAADSTAIMYSTTARTSVPVRCLGYIEIQSNSGNAGYWSNSPTKLQLMGPGIHRTGDIVQHLRVTDATQVTITTGFPQDATIPQITEGNFAFEKAITPTSAINLIRAYAIVYGNGSQPTLQPQAALFRSDSTNALTTESARAFGFQIPLVYEGVVGTTSLITFSVRVGNISGGSVYYNGYSDGSSGIFGAGGRSSSLDLWEIMQ